MSDVDWLIASALFLGAAVFAILLVPGLLPQSNPITESQYDAVAQSVQIPARVATVLLGAPCDGSAFDCTGYVNAIQLQGFGDQNAVFSKPFSGFSGDLFAIVNQNQPSELILLDENASDFVPAGTNALNLIFQDLGNNGFSAQNDTLQSNSTKNASFAEYTNPINGSTLDLNIFLKAKTNLSPAHVSGVSSSISDPTKGSGIRWFSNASEFWVTVPKDQNLLIQSSAFQWQVNQPFSETVPYWIGGSANSASWWDSSSNDFNDWSYRIPITFNSGSVDRSDFVTQLGIGGDYFSKALEALGVSAQQIDPHSFRLIEYIGRNCTDAQGNNSFCNAAPIDCDASATIPEMSCYNSSSQYLLLRWTVSGTTLKQVSRTYFLYFDLQNDDDGIMQSGTSSGALNPTSSIDRAYYSVGSVEQEKRIVSRVSTDQLFLGEPNTAIVSFQNLVEPVWLDATKKYRIGFTVDPGNFDRIDYNATTSIDFNNAFFQAGCVGCNLDNTKTAFYEVSDLESGKIVGQLDDTLWNLAYYPFTAIGTLDWIVQGTTIAKTKRYYHLYFDRVKP